MVEVLVAAAEVQAEQIAARARSIDRCGEVHTRDVATEVHNERIDIRVASGNRALRREVVHVPAIALQCDVLHIRRIARDHFVTPLLLNVGLSKSRESISSTNPT